MEYGLALKVRVWPAIGVISTPFERRSFRCERGGLRYAMLMFFLFKEFIDVKFFCHTLF